MKKLLLIFLVFITVSSFSQKKEIDSLKNVLANSNSKEDKLTTLKLLSNKLINFETVDNSLVYYKQMLSLSKELKNYKLASRSYRYLSESYMKKEDAIKAIYFVKQSLKLNDSINSHKYYLHDINQLGRVYHHFQQYNKAIETYNKGVNAYKKGQEDDVISTIYGNIGVAYSQLGDKDKAILYYTKQAKSADEHNNIQQKSNANYYIASVYRSLEQYEKAEKYYFKALQDSTKFKLKTYISRNHHGLAINYSHWGKYDKALSQNKIALKYYRQTGNKLYEFDVLNNTAVNYLRMDKPQIGLEFAKKALIIANSLHHKLAINGAKTTIVNALIELKQYNVAEKKLVELAKDTINNKTISLIGKADIYENFYLVSKGKNNYKKSLLFLEKFKTLNDSILKKQRDSRVSEIETKYQTEKKEKQLLLKKEELQNQKLKNQRLIIYLGIVSLLAILFFGIYMFYRKQSKMDKIELENAVNNIEILKQKHIQKLIQQKSEREELEQEYHKKNKKLKTKLKEALLPKELVPFNEKLFHDFLQEKYNLSLVELKSWISIIEGISLKEFTATYSKNSINNIKYWRKTLFKKVRKLNGIKENQLQKIKVAKIYHDELDNYLKKET